MTTPVKHQPLLAIARQMTDAQLAKFIATGWIILAEEPDDTRRWEEGERRCAKEREIAELKAKGLHREAAAREREP